MFAMNEFFVAMRFIFDHVGWSYAAIWMRACYILIVIISSNMYYHVTWWVMIRIESTKCFNLNEGKNDNSSIVCYVFREEKQSRWWCERMNASYWLPLSVLFKFYVNQSKMVSFSDSLPVIPMVFKVLRRKSYFIRSFVCGICPAYHPTMMLPFQNNHPPPSPTKLAENMLRNGVSRVKTLRHEFFCVEVIK